jgi:DNA (cytosine-5)-methyltransferase 1
VNLCLRRKAYYNENNPYAAQWLRNLIAKGLIADGEVDDRSITEVRPRDLRGYKQCHFFAGLGGWAYALRLAGVPDDTPVWTGSCPCGPWSSAGRQDGFSDERHLWPEWFRIIRECRPPVVFGEQVEAAIRWGWMDAVQGDLEAEMYAVGFTVLGAHSVKAPHIRQRLYWVADRMVYADHSGQREEHLQRRLRDSGETGGMDDADRPRLERSAGQGIQERGDGFAGAGETFWDSCEWLPCRDGKVRPIEPGILPLAHGVPRRLEQVRSFGNAIAPQTASAFIRAFLSSAKEGAGCLACMDGVEEIDENA